MTVWSYLGRLLGSRWTVDRTSDGQEALEAIRAHLPDLVIAEVMMPRVDGLELVRALRADESTERLPVVLLSARAGEEARIEGLEAGADNYLVKPFSSRELVATVAARPEISQAREASRSAAEQARQHLYHLLMSAPVPFCCAEARPTPVASPRPTPVASPPAPCRPSSRPSLRLPGRTAAGFSQLAATGPRRSPFTSAQSDGASWRTVGPDQRVVPPL